MFQDLNALIPLDDYCSKLPTAYISSIKQNCLPQLFRRITIHYKSGSALYWLFECVKIFSKISPRFENYCKQGSVVLEPSKD